MANPNAERRKEPRHDATLSVELGGAGDTLSVSSLNIGAGGVYVRVPRFIEPLTKLSVSMLVPGPTPNEPASTVEAEAIVVRTLPESPSDEIQEYEIACAFLDLADDARDAINRYILTHRVQTPA
jgi:hypothetical protein